VISRISGRVVTKEIDRVELLTSAGVAYEVAIPLSAFEALPALGGDVTLHTHLVVREDGWQLIGFSTPYERQVFRAILTAKGVGPALALSLLSALSADHLVRAIREHDLVTLQGVPRVGRKKAEQLVLDLADKLDALFDPADAPSPSPARSDAPGTEEAILGLVRLGYARGDADRAVRGVLDGGPGSKSVPDLIRAALPRLASR
jgi:holliday junction DNA helicase RuvA